MKPESFLPPEVVAALESGRTMEAIQPLRDLRGLGLAEAKSAVQQYLERRQTSARECFRS
jgi:ribosomal protein L7/L12